MALHLLIDHGAFHNFGDAAMLEAVVRRLDRLTEGNAILHVRDCPMDSPIWALPNVERLRFEIREPARLMVDYGDPPVLQRLFQPSASHWTRQCFRWLGRASSGWVPVQQGRFSPPLSFWSRRYDGLVVAGGGGLNDLFPEQIWQRACLINAMAAAGKPSVLTGQQLGPFTSDITRSALKRSLARASFVGVREPGPSLEICREAGLSAEHYAVMGDDALGLPPAPSADVQAALRHLDLTPGRFLAVNVRSGYYAPAYDHHLRAFAEMARRVACARNLGVLFVPIATGPLDSDLASAVRLSEVTDGKPIPVFDSRGRSAALVKGVLGQAWAAMGVSYHFCHFALEQGVPATLLHADDYYRQKGEGLARMWGDARLAMPLERLGDGSASEALLSTFDDRPLRDRLQQRSTELRHGWEVAFDKAISTHLLETLIH